MPNLDPTPLLRQLLRAESVTPDRSECQDILAKRLAAVGFKTEQLNFGKVRNLWASMEGESDEHLVFCGHSDVVPPGDDKNWRHAPFAAAAADGFIYGRGATDMKGSLSAFITATLHFLSSHQGRTLPSSFGLLITGDEEGEAVDGTAAVLKELKQRGLRIRHCLVGEPTSKESLGDTLKNGRRGSLTLRLTLRGKQGHPGYMRSSENVLHQATALVGELAKWNTAADAPGEGTVFHLTEIRSESIAENVTAPIVHLQGNWRYAAEVSAETIQSETEQLLKKMTGERFFLDAISWRRGARPYECAPARLGNTLIESITEVCNIQPQFSTAGGVSDGRFFADYDPQTEIMEFGPRALNMHAFNECISIDELQKLTAVYLRFLERFFNSTQSKQ